MTDNAIIIPTRLEATRLPNKPLKKINGKEMILHVYDAAKKANCGEVIVATPNDQIYDLIISNQGICIKTKPDHKTGTDRIFEVFDKFLKRKPKIITNLQGDMPNIKPENIKTLTDYMTKNLCDIATLSSKFKDQAEINDINNVKVLTNKSLQDNKFNEAIDFFRSGQIKKDKYIYHHIGIYAFTSVALTKYVKLTRSNLEIERDLEQMRAIQNKLSIRVGLSDSVPLGVDVEKDIEKISREMA